MKLSSCCLTVIFLPHTRGESDELQDKIKGVRQKQDKLRTLIIRFDLQVKLLSPSYTKFHECQ